MNERPGLPWRRTAAPPPPGYGVDTLAPAESGPDREPLPSWFRRGVVYVGFVVLGFLFASWVVTQLGGFWPIMAFAFFIALAIEPIVNYLERRGLRRGAGTGIVLLSLIVGTVAFFGVFGNLLVVQLVGLVQDLPSILDAVFAWSNERFGTDLDFQSALNSFGLDPSDLAGVASELGAGLVAAVVSAVGVLFAGAAMLLFAFYFAADGPKLRRTVASWLPPNRQRVFYTVWTISANKAGTYVISRGILAVISAAVSALFFAIVGLDYWLPLALWVGFVSQFIPTIGTYLAGALPVVIALTQGSPWLALAIVVFIVAYQQIENMVLTPRVTQQTLEVHAAVAFGSVLVGGILFGATGALLAIPVVAIVQAVLETYGKRYTLVPDLQQFETAAAGGNADQLPTSPDPQAPTPSDAAPPVLPRQPQEVAGGSAPP
jgi:predicted PurR-regulated permease PerM